MLKAEMDWLQGLWNCPWLNSALDLLLYYEVWKVNPTQFAKTIQQEPPGGGHLHQIITNATRQEYNTFKYNSHRVSNKLGQMAKLVTRWNNRLLELAQTTKRVTT